MRSLDFLTESAQTEVLADMEELYNGLSERGLDDQQIQERIGSPRDVAAEYRLSEELDRLEQSPGAASGMRVAYASLTGRLARGAAFQLFGLVWLTLSVCSLSLIICATVGIVLSVAAIAGYEPLVTTLAVPGIPVVIGVLMGVSATAATIALLLGNRLLMRALSRWMRSRLRRRHRAGEGVSSRGSGDRGATGERSAGQISSRGARRWLNSGRAAWQIALAAIVIATVGAALTPILDAPEYLLVMDRQESLPVSATTVIEVHADEVDVRVTIGEQAEARLSGNLRRTFAQSVDLQVEGDGTTVIVETTYREGLSWGINPRPVLVVALPQDHLSRLTVHSDGGQVDLAGLPEQLRGLVRVDGG
jgi:uncharacterized membrane protein